LKNDGATKKKNLLQLLLDAEASSTEKNNEQGFTEQNKKLTIDVNRLLLILQTCKFNDFYLKKELKMNMILFMLAGYETTSSTLTYCSYVLAKYPDEQHKLIDEINSHFNKESKVILQILFIYKAKKYLFKT